MKPGSQLFSHPRWTDAVFEVVEPEPVAVLSALEGADGPADGGEDA